MSIDLYQLPIPDWGLECPRCHYPLRGLPQHRCPECGLDIDVAELVRTWTRLRPPRLTGRETPLRDWGLVCSGCRYPLRGLPSTVCPECGRDNDPREQLPRQRWFALDDIKTVPLTFQELLILLQEEQIPHIRTEEKGLQQIYGGGRADRVRVERDYFFDFLDALDRYRQTLSERRHAAAHVTWRCPECGEENPGNFEVCWQCSADFSA